MEDIFCPVCNSSKIIELRYYRANSDLLKGSKLANCENCEMVFMYPQPSEEDWADYNNHYFESAHQGLSSKKRARSYHRALGKIRANYAMKFVKNNNIEVKNVFEIGPGYGEFAEYWMQVNPNSVYCVWETDDSLHKRINSLGIKIINDYPSNEVDMLVLSHVLEHTLKPYEFLGEISNSLVKGGAIMIEVPCQDYLYKNIDEPHTLFFNDQAMHRLLKSHNFQNISLSYHGAPHSELVRENRSSRYNKTLKRLKQEIFKLANTPDKNNQLLKNLTNDEWRACSPLLPHIQQPKPARWLRAVAIKR